MFDTLCGNTPLINIKDNIWAKLETYNPTGSVKDRMVSYVVTKAIESGKISSRPVLCEATSGHTGISLSAIAASLGLKCKIFMPINMSDERKQMMRSYGSELVFSEPSDFLGAIEMRDVYLKKNRNAWTPNQFHNQDNIECHYKITAPEIHSQVNTWSAFVHGSGTGGTMMGVKNYLDDSHLQTKTFLVVPAEEKHGIQGINDGADFLVDRAQMCDIIEIRTEDAIDRAKKFSKETGILVGISSGANILASEQISKHITTGQIVTMLCDRGERYMSIYQKGKYEKIKAGEYDVTQGTIS